MLQLNYIVRMGKCQVDATLLVAKRLQAIDDQIPNDLY